MVNYTSGEVNMNNLWQSLKRRKQFADENDETKLARVLNLFDLTALGVGSTLGLGVYVLAGAVSINTGPAVNLYFQLHWPNARLKLDFLLFYSFTIGYSLLPYCCHNIGSFCDMLC